MKCLKQTIAWVAIWLLLFACIGCGEPTPTTSDVPPSVTSTTTSTAASDTHTAFDSETFDGMPQGDEPFLIINNNVPYFTENDLTMVSYESYSELDALGRCGAAMACVGKEIMPTEDRESISAVKPSGWHNESYDFVDGGYVYNRCHLLGFQLTGENANEKNLITGTRYMNVEGMLPFENMVADYIHETGNHVMLRVTPHYNGDDLVARGVFMEAYSVEDRGEGICYNVFCYNMQPGVEIDYATGYNSAADSGSSETGDDTATYVLNTNTKKIHETSCHHVEDIQDHNYAESTLSIDELEAQGYSCCKTCLK